MPIRLKTNIAVGIKTLLNKNKNCRKLFYLESFIYVCVSVYLYSPLIERERNNSISSYNLYRISN
jgi:surface polysaccharide O-acyltransferase-like enzyme